MNYQRIYNEFIADRQTKVIEGYCESHHIVPSHLGGTDTEDNLINLTPSDHLFAHLLLAKIHGGAMWLAVKMMCEIEPTKYSQRQSLITNKRRRFAFAKMREGVAQYYSDNYSGIDSPHADQEIYTFVNVDGSEMTGNRFELATLFEGVWGREVVRALLNDKYAMSAGWYYPIHNPLGLTGVEIQRKRRDLFDMTDTNRFTVYDENRKAYTVNNYELKRMAGDERAHFAIQRNRRTHGFSLNPNEKTTEEIKLEVATKNAAARGSIKGRNNPMSDHTIYEFVHYLTGEIFKGDRFAFAEYTGLDQKRTVHRIVACKHALIKGWRLATNPLTPSKFAITMAKKLATSC